MRKIIITLVWAFSAVLVSCSGNLREKPPVAEKVPYTVFDNRIDNYFWMRLSDKQKTDSVPDEQTQKVLDNLNSENEYAEAVMRNTEDLQRTLFDEIVGRIKKDDESVPYFENGYYYYSKYSEGREYPVYYRKKGSLDAPEEILLDVNKLAEGHRFCSVAQLSVSRDNKILAYSLDTISRRRYTLYFLNLESGMLLPDKIDNVSGEMEWAADNKTVFYTGKNFETLRADKILLHRIGDTAMKDDTVYYEADET
jgi:oligopeptidase B